MRLIVVTAGDSGVRPIDRWFVSDPIDGALKGTDASKRFRSETNTTIELAQQVFVTEADLIRNLRDAHRIATAPDNLQRMADGAWRPSAHSLQKPGFNKGEAGLVITRLAEVIAQPVDLAAEDGVKFHDA